MNNGEHEDSALACLGACTQLPGCRGYTWKTDTHECWLKSRVDDYVYSPDSDSGFCPSAAPAECDGPFSGKDNRGTNMNNGEHEDSALACLGACTQLPGCRGYTWKTDTHECWLKSQIDDYVESTDSESGSCP